MDKFLSLLILWLQLNWVSSKQDVSQSPEALSVREGDSVDLNCSYPDSALYFLQWFRQNPGKGLTSLLSIQTNQNEQTSGRITVSLDKSSGHSASHIATSQPRDSTTDLCAGNQEYWGAYSFSSGSSLPTVLSLVCSGQLLCLSFCVKHLLISWLPIAFRCVLLYSCFYMVAPVITFT
ncbi:hypothetical protein FD754_023042 [Muntiacus muntjak]|uniref:Ig-like domain-containing protein n=1 Tax=Muntiacus muntjak TaxID=9888 RepID=A0A5N3UUY4_MUNMU|nr:hypothetical protein FD754_023042 [Muntiacus muntjak]